MARKTLLTEIEVRRFMKLAKMQPIGTNKLQEFAMEDEVADIGDEGGEEFEDTAELEVEDPEPAGTEIDLSNEEADVLVSLGNKIEDVQEPAGPEEEEFLDVEEEPLEGGGAELEAEEDLEVPGTRGTYQERRARRAPRLSENSIEQEEERGHYHDNAMSDDERIEAIRRHLDALEGDRDYDEDRDEDLEEGNRQDALVQEVARRVAARLAKENQQTEMVDQLAERIMNRLVKK